MTELTRAALVLTATAATLGAASAWVRSWPAARPATTAGAPVPSPSAPALPCPPGELPERGLCLPFGSDQALRSALPLSVHAEAPPGEVRGLEWPVQLAAGAAPVHRPPGSPLWRLPARAGDGVVLPRLRGAEGPARVLHRGAGPGPEWPATLVLVEQPVRGAEGRVRSLLLVFGGLAGAAADPAADGEAPAPSAELGPPVGATLEPGARLGSVAGGRREPALWFALRERLAEPATHPAVAPSAATSAPRASDSVSPRPAPSDTPPPAEPPLRLLLDDRSTDVAPGPYLSVATPSAADGPRPPG